MLIQRRQPGVCPLTAVTVEWLGVPVTCGEFIIIKMLKGKFIETLSRKTAASLKTQHQMGESSKRFPLMAALRWVLMRV